ARIVYHEGFMPRFSCPNCNKVLKTSTPIAAGKKVKCPGCSQVFPFPAIEDETAIQADKPVLSERKTASSLEGRPKRRSAQADDEDVTERSSSRKARARVDDLDEEDD